MSFLYLVVAVTGLTVLGVKIYRSNYFGIIEYSLVWLLVIYFLVPSYILYFGSGYNDFYSKYDSALHLKETEVFLLLVLSLLSYLIGLFFGRGASIRVLGTSDEKKTLQAVFIIAMVGFIGLIVYVYKYGGLTYILENISQIRSGTDNNKNYVGAFFKMFTYYFDVALFSYLAFLIKKVKPTRFLYFLALIFVSLVLFRALISGGRQHLINVFVGFAFISTITNVKLNLPKILLGMCVAIGIVFYGKSVIFQVFSSDDVYALAESASSNASMDRLISQLSHPYLAVHTAIETGLGERSGQDFILWFLKPLKLFSVDVPDSIAYFHTYQISQEWESTVPPGLAGLLLYESGVMLLAFGFLVAGFFCSVIEKATLVSKRDSPLLFGCYVIFSLYFPTLFFKADPALVFQGTVVFDVLFVALFLTGCLRLSIRKGS